MYLTPGCFYAAERTVIMIRRIRSRVSLLLLFAVICTVLSGCRIGSGEVDITTVDTKPGGTVTSVVGTKTPDDSTALPRIEVLKEAVGKISDFLSYYRQG